MARTLLLRFGVRFAVTCLWWLCVTVAHAQPAQSPVIDEEPPIVQPGPSPRNDKPQPTWFVGAHLGMGYLTREGDGGGDVTGDLDFGRYVQRNVALVLTLGRNPHLDVDPGYQQDGIVRRDSLFVGILGELHASYAVLALGGGVVRETSTGVVWLHDGIGRIPDYYPQERLGGIALARIGAAYDLARNFAIDVIAQATAMRFRLPSGYNPEQSLRPEAGYGLTIELGARYVWR